MKRFVLAALALAACTPQPSTPSSTAPDPLAVRYEVRVGQTALPNVRSVAVDGPDIETIEVRTGTSSATTLAPGRIGMIKLVIRTDWAASEQTMETWRNAFTATSTTLQPLRQTITLVITQGSAAPASYAFQRCLPTEHDLALAAQDSRAEQVWRATCEGVVRS